MLIRFRSIAFFFNETEQGGLIADHALAIAQQHGAHLIGIFRLELGQAKFAGFARGEAAIRQALAQLHQKYERKITDASRHLEDRARKHGVSIEFRVVESDVEFQDVTAHLLHCDLVLVGHTSAAFSPERLLLNAGAPLLLVPEAWQGKSIGTRVVLAWNASRQARRAISDAMPFICAAEQVKVLVVNADQHPERYGENPGSDLAHYLARHGASVELACISSQGVSVAETIRSYAVTAGADLLVIGAYSRARIGELLLGGVTRDWLAKPTLPLLLAQ